MENNLRSFCHKAFILLPLILAGLCSISQASIFTVTTTGDAGAGSLRDQLAAAAALPGKDTIRFAIPGAGKQIITPATSLPTIQDTLFIDGFSQSGIGVVNIVLDGSVASGVGFSFQATALCKVEGIEMRNFSTGIYALNTKKSNFSNLVFYNNGNGIQTISSDSNTISGNNLLRQNGPALMLITGKDNDVTNNTIDTTAAASIYIVGGSNYNKITNNQVSNGNAQGIYLSGNCNFNLIENNQVNKCLSGGIYLSGGVSSNNVINNQVLNSGNYGIFIEGGSFYNVLRYNTVGGSNGPGISLSSNAQWNTIQSNFIGTNNLSANLGNTSHGVSINNSSYKNTFLGNVIGFNQGEGIYNQSDSTIINQNRIGIDSTGNAMSNALNGLVIFYGTQNLKVRDNYICNNLQNGIDIKNGGTNRNELNRNVIYGNGIKAINLNPMPGYANGNKQTAYITAVTSVGANYTLKIYAELSDQLIEVFRGDATNQNALEFLSDGATNIGGYYWQVTVSTPVANPYFLVTARNASFSTSELGLDVSRELIVTNTNDAGSGSLRNAIDFANLVPDTSTISFNITGAAPYIIQPVATLPNILYCTHINGRSQPGVELMGSGTGTGLVFYDNNSTGSFLEGLYIHHFAAGAELRFNSNVTINHMRFSYNNNPIMMSTNFSPKILNSIFSNNLIGLDISMYANGSIVDSCTVINNSTHGIQISLTSNHTITNNIIYGNMQTGINIGMSSNVRMENNIIGLDSTKSQKKPNGNRGIAIDFSGSNFWILKNFIGGNAGSGIYLSRSSAKVMNNYIGTNELGVDLGNGLDGIEISTGGQAKIGDGYPDSSNVIGFNGRDGVNSISTSTNSTLVRNYVGVDKLGRDIHNYRNGIMVQYGGIQIGNVMPNYTNYIGYNLKHGIVVSGSGSVVSNNFIGISPLESNASNKGYGILVGQASNLIVNNQVAHNDSGGVYVSAVQNKISQTLFTNTLNKAIALSFVKDTAAITMQAIAQDTLTLSGTGITDDSVEVFVNTTSATQQGSKYVGITRVVGGVWSLKIPVGPDFSPLQDNYYTTTSRNVVNTTSEFSAPYKVGVYLCNSSTYSVLPDTRNICSGDSILLSAALNNVQYQWYFNNNPISAGKNLFAKETGLYKVVMTDGNSCSLKDSVSTTVLSVALESNFLMSSVASLGEEVIVIDVSYSIPQISTWDFGAAQFRKEGYYYLLTYPDTGQYTISLVSTLDGCERRAERDIHIINEQNIDDPFQYTGDFKLVKVHPNPNDGIFYAQISLYEAKDLNVKLYNNNGTQLLLNEDHSGSDNYMLDFDISAMESGAYLLRLTVGQTTKGILIIRQ